MFFLKEDTAVDIKLGPFVDKGDGVAYETGMAAAMDHGDTGVRLSKNGGAFADRNEGTEPSYDAFGYYLVKLDTTDTNTPGRLKVIFGDAAVCLPCEANFQVVNDNVFDSLLSAADTDYLEVDALQVAGVAGSTQVQSDVQTVLETNNLDHLCKVTTGVAADGDLSNHVVDQTILSHIMTLGADTDKFKASTDSLQGQRDTLPAANAAALATATQAYPTDFHVNLKEINDQATKLEQLMDLTTGVNADADLTGIVVDKSVLSHIMTPAADTSTYDASTDSLEGTRNHIGDGTNLTEAGGDGDHLTEAGATGDHLTAINLPNQTMDITGNITGTLSGSVGSLSGHTVQTADHTTNLARLIIALVNKEIITKATGNIEQFNDAGASLGTIATAITSDATTVTRLRMVI